MQTCIWEKITTVPKQATKLTERWKTLLYAKALFEALNYPKFQCTLIQRFHRLRPIEGWFSSCRNFETSRSSSWLLLVTYFETSNSVPNTGTNMHLKENFTLIIFSLFHLNWPRIGSLFTKMILFLPILVLQEFSKNSQNYWWKKRFA